MRFHEMNNRAKLGRVNEFRVWRAAQAVDWDCTSHDLAQELGLSRGAVQRICKRRGWADKLADALAGGYAVREVDVSMKYGAMQ